MVVEAHEPLWSMGDDTPTPALGRVDRPVADHLRQAFAQVTNPPIDPEREKAVMDLRVDLGRRPALLGGPPRVGRRSRTIRLNRPVVADRDALLDAFPGRVRRLEATWPAGEGPTGLAAALERLAEAAVAAAGTGAELVVLSDRSFSARGCRSRRSSPPAPSTPRSPMPASAAGPTSSSTRPTSSTSTSLAMTLAAGATAVVPWLAVELPSRRPASRGAEDLTPDAAVDNLLTAFEAGLRKTLARMGISTIASYIGGLLFESIELDDDVRSRCFRGAPAWPGTIGLVDLAERALRRADAARAIADDLPSNRLPDPGFARFRADGEAHLFSPRNAAEFVVLASGDAPTIDAALERYRSALAGPASVVRDGLRNPPRRRRPPSTSPTSSPPATSSAGSSCRRCRSGRSRRRPTRR